MEIATIAGNPITVGAIASTVVLLLKKTPWYPLFKNQPMRSRTTVAVICLAITALIQYIEGGVIIDTATAFNAFLSYVTAAATYDHFFKS